MEYGNKKIDELDKSNIYLLHVEYINEKPKFAQLISFFTKLRIKHYENIQKPIITHTAKLINLDNRWIICEVGNNGKAHSIIKYNKNIKYFATDFGKLLPGEHYDIFNEYCKRLNNNPFCAILHYPFVKACASYELPKFKGIAFISIILNKIFDIIRDFIALIFNIFNAHFRFCSEASTITLQNINNKRDENNFTRLSFPVNLIKLINSKDGNLFEIYPQEVFDACNENSFILDLRKNG